MFGPPVAFWCVPSPITGINSEQQTNLIMVINCSVIASHSILIRLNRSPRKHLTSRPQLSEVHSDVERSLTKHKVMLLIYAPPGVSRWKAIMSVNQTIHGQTNIISVALRIAGIHFFLVNWICTEQTLFEGTVT